MSAVRRAVPHRPPSSAASMHARTPTAEAATAACGVAAHALVEAGLTEIAALRDAPVPAGGPSLPPRFLRHADEQTVVGLRAVLEAIAATPEPRPSFADYGVVGAPCHAGSIATAQSLAQFRTAGGVAVSPHVVPQCSLHSLAGAVSVSLGMHGPNVGSSGGRHAVSEGLFTALSLLAAAPAADGSLPGVWLVISGWTAEPGLDAAGRPAGSPAIVAEDRGRNEAPPVCRAVAVALTPAAGPGGGRRIELHMPATLRVAHPTAADPCPAERAGAAAEILAFARGLAAGDAAEWSHACPWGGTLRLSVGDADARSRAAGRDGGRREAA